MAMNIRYNSLYNWIVSFVLYIKKIIILSNFTAVSYFNFLNFLLFLSYRNLHIHVTAYKGHNSASKSFKFSTMLFLQGQDE